MQNIPLVLKQEFLRRVTSKMFLFSTLFGPLILLFFGIVGFVSVGAIGDFTSTEAIEETTQQVIALVDDTGRLTEGLVTTEATAYRIVAPASTVADSVRTAVLAGKYDGYLHIPAGIFTNQSSPTYFSRKEIPSSIMRQLTGAVERALQEYRISEYNLPPEEVLDILNTTISLQYARLLEENNEAEETDESGSTWIYSGLGTFMGFLIYIAMLGYGSTVMQVVIEEKTSRIVEVLLSSMRPFELLMGKVLGVGMMGLVQINCMGRIHWWCGTGIG